MSLAGSLLDSRQRGPALIGVGLSIVLVAQVWVGVPITAAIMLVGCGATLALQSQSSRLEQLCLINLFVYASLGSLAVAAQTHAALSGPTGHIGVVLLLDHLAALALLIVMVRVILRRIDESLTP